MEKKACCEEEQRAWASDEDEILVNYVQVHGEGNWRDLPIRAGLKRCDESCKNRWLRIHRGIFTWDEEELIIRLHNLLGNRWSIIAGRLPGRTEDEIKNYWNTYLSNEVEGKQNNKYNVPTTSMMTPTTTSMLSVESPSTSINPKESLPAVIKPKVVRLTRGCRVNAGSQYKTR